MIKIVHKTVLKRVKSISQLVTDQCVYYVIVSNLVDIVSSMRKGKFKLELRVHINTDAATSVALILKYHRDSCLGLPKL